MPKIPVKQVTIYMTIQARARDKTIERQIKMGLAREISGRYEIQQVLIEDIPELSSRIVHLNQLTTRMDQVLGEIEEMGDNALQELEERCRAIEEFTEPEEEGEAEG